MTMSLFSLSAAATLIIQLGGFIIAYALQTEVFYDILGGVNFLVLGIGTFLLSESSTDLELVSLTSLVGWNRSTLATAGFIVSRSWLLIFLAWRAHSRKGDARFDGVKDKFVPFLTFWMVQGMWVYLISMPTIYINNNNTNNDGELSTLDWVAWVGFVLGAVTEILSDIQKTLWVERGRVGGFCNVGLWSYSRHPNYFGEILQWWCSWVLAYGSNGKMWVWGLCILSPLFTMHILLNLTATGVWNAEGGNLKRYYTNPECAERYKAYRQSTSILIPMIGYSAIPLGIKRALFFEWERYEYDEAKQE